LKDKHEWDSADIKRLWAFGLEDYTANLIGDKTIGMQYMKECKPSIVNAFHQTLREGPLCHEKLRGVYFRVTDAKLHSDANHRSA